MPISPVRCAAASQTTEYNPIAARTSAIAAKIAVSAAELLHAQALSDERVERLEERDRLIRIERRHGRGNDALQSSGIAGGAGRDAHRRFADLPHRVVDLVWNRRG